MSRDGAALRGAPAGMRASGAGVRGDETVAAPAGPGTASSSRWAPLRGDAAAGRRASSAGIRGDENVAAPADPGTAASSSRWPPLRAVQPPAPGAAPQAQWSLPPSPPRKGSGLTRGMVPGTGAGSAVRASLPLTKPNSAKPLAPRKNPAKPTAWRSGLVTRSVEEPLNRVRHTISLGKQNHNNAQRCDSDASAKVEGCTDHDFVDNSEDVLKLQMELDIFKAILAEEKKSATAEANQLRYNIESLESDLAELLRESAKLREISDKTSEKDEVCRQAEAETAKVIMSLQDQLASKSRELDELVSDRKLLEAQMLKSNEKLAALEGNLAKTVDELSIVSTELRSLRHDLCKLSYEKQCCEAQVLAFKEKLEMAEALIAESGSMSKAQQIAEEKDKEIKLLERSVEDLEVTIRELENKVNIVKEEANHDRMKREELELKMQNIKQQNELLKFISSSKRNASSSCGDEVINLADSIRHSKGIQNELLGAHGVSKSKPEIGIVDKYCEDTSLDEGLLEPKYADVEKEETCSSDEDYQPETSEFEQSSPNEHMELEQPDLQGVDVESDLSPSVEPVVEILLESELPPCASVRHIDPVDYMKAPSDVLRRLRSRNHYEGQRTSTDKRFWSIEQQDLYTFIYNRAKLFKMHWIDWSHIDTSPEFAGVRKRFSKIGLEQIVCTCCHWDSELIRQFYSTVHISADKTVMTWMSNGQKITTNKRAWEERFNIPSGAHTEIHSQFFLSDDDQRTLYTSAEFPLGDVNGLSPMASIAYNILKRTIYPRFGKSTHCWNILYHIVEQHQFDIISFIFGEIDSFISDHSRVEDKLLYAPIIMQMIIKAFEYEGPRESEHCPYKPRGPNKPKCPKQSHPPAAHAVESPGEATPLEPTPSLFESEVAAGGHKAKSF